MYYCQAERARVTAALEREMFNVPQRLVFAAVTRALGEAYRELGFVERHPYELQAHADKWRYMAEMDAWLEEVRKRRGEVGRGRVRPRKNAPSTTNAGSPVTRKKRRLSAYNVYFSTVRPAMREALPHAPAKEIHRMIGLKWKQLPNAERKRFEELANERHEAAMRATAAGGGVGSDDEDAGPDGMRLQSSTGAGHLVPPAPGAAWPESLVPLTNLPPILNQCAGSHLELAVYPPVGPGTESGLRTMTGRGYNKRQTINVPPVYKRAKSAISLLGSGLQHAATTRAPTTMPISTVTCAAPHPAAWAYARNDCGADLPTPYDAGKKGVLTPWVPVGCPPVLHGVPIWQSPMSTTVPVDGENDGAENTRSSDAPPRRVTFAVSPVLSPSLTRPPLLETFSVSPVPWPTRTPPAESNDAPVSRPEPRLAVAPEAAGAMREVVRKVMADRRACKVSVGSN
ncbi:hypothetical protein AMAG_19934 [Allomyces macrogynus ATCC 38327]|uniref:HMG box domain-containing protein n=1 Tax=Allomyces macrogynus (strain ATCC 38327) TaxID=578462 RepID=A0A0L0T401_ALLM3|nr:hypothetical protein AMAG_19934 [Allomyces macrogynus ATCC 38327]|eukprot:KNE69440.1 hypothetical protein AMAG_19934 [Allomyces macrogynus ATCC 38327]